MLQGNRAPSSLKGNRLLKDNQTSKVLTDFVQLTTPIGYCVSTWFSWRTFNVSMPAWIPRMPSYQHCQEILATRTGTECFSRSGLPYCFETLTLWLCSCFTHLGWVSKWLPIKAGCPLFLPGRMAKLRSLNELKATGRADWFLPTYFPLHQR